jgi:hypothetical protein
MLKGTIQFVAKIVSSKSISFEPFDFDPHMPGIKKIEIECRTGKKIKSTVHVTSVAAADEGIALATKANAAGLDRIAFLRSLTIEKPRSTGYEFSRVNTQPGVHDVIAGALVSVGGTMPHSGVSHIRTEDLKPELERPERPEDRYFSLFRSALQSESPAEKFMYLYHILMTLHEDKPRKVDTFIVRQEPDVPQTPDPRPDQGHIKETVYTRLRHEFAHNRPGGNLDATKAEMANWLHGLISLVKQAIEMPARPEEATGSMEREVLQRERNAVAPTVMADDRPSETMRKAVTEWTELRDALKDRPEVEKAASEAEETFRQRIQAALKDRPDELEKATSEATEELRQRLLRLREQGR